MKSIKDFQRDVVDYAYLGNNKALVMTYYGCRLLIDTRNIQHMRIISHGCYEPAVAWAIEKYLKTGGRMIDVGTNLGYFTLLGCKKAGSTGHVIGFEANPVIYDMMASSVFANAYRARSKTFNHAVFNTKKTFEFTWDSAGHGGGRLVTNNNQNLDNNKAEVEAVKLDDFLQGDDRKVDVIKIDTEGSDPFVIDGARKILSENPGCVVITEWSPRFMSSRGFATEDAIEMIYETFSKVELIEKIGKSTMVTKAELGQVKHGNLLLTV